MSVADSLILLPAFGCPALADREARSQVYRIFVSMLIIFTDQSANRALRREQIANELGLERFAFQNDFSATVRFSPDSIELLNSQTSYPYSNLVQWETQPDFIRFLQGSFHSAYLQRNNLTGTCNPDRVGKFDFMLALPSEISPGMYGLVSRSEREQILSNSPMNQWTSNLILQNINRSDMFDPYRNSAIVKHHPVFVPDGNREFLNVAQLSDTHVSRRWDAMHYWSKVRKTERDRRWPFYGTPSGTTIQVRENARRFLQYPCHPDDPDHWDTFNNPNRRFEQALESANNNDDVDIIVITGDLIDYNVGYREIPGEHEIENMNYLSHGRESYFRNENWSLFYELLERNYREKPIFTILGNHDYRYYFYGPMARGWGHPVVYHLFAHVRIGAQNYADALGINVNRAPVNNGNIERDQRTALGLIYPPALVGETPREAISKSYDNIRWYNFVINPALDYCFRFRRMAFLFLDWRLGETREPAASDMLTDSQMRMFTAFLASSQRKTVLISMHASVFCTPTDQYHDGMVFYSPNCSLRGDLSQGSFIRHKREFIQQVVRRRNAQTIVLSGHTHKNRVYLVECAGDILWALHELEIPGTGVINFEREGSARTDFPRNTAVFCVTTSTAFRKLEDNFRTPGYRVIEFHGDGTSGTYLRGLFNQVNPELALENQALDRERLPTGHPNKT